MVRIAVVTLATCSLMTFTPGPAAQTPALPSVDQILEKNIEGTGGRAAIEKITSVTAQGTISVPDAGVDGTIQLFQKPPNKAATIVAIAGTQQREGFDGTIGWSEDPQNGLRIKSGAELAEAQHTAVFGRELKMKTLYPKMTVTGRERVGTREAFVVEAVPTEGTPAKMYYDAENGLMLRQIVTRQSPAGPLQVDVTFEDYRVVDGVKRPFTIRQVTSMFTAVIQLTEVKHNVPIDDKIFSKPGL